MSGSEPSMDAVEKVADLIEQVQTDWQMSHPENALPLAETTALALLDEFPQLALEGREELGIDIGNGYVMAALDDPADRKRTVWVSPWSEVLS